MPAKDSVPSAATPAHGRQTSQPDYVHESTGANFRQRREQIEHEAALSARGVNWLAQAKRANFTFVFPPHSHARFLH